MNGAAGAAPAQLRVTIDGRTVEVPPGTLIVEAARRAGIPIPVFCYHPKLKPAGVCRMCLVKVEKMPKLVTACTTPVAEGMVVDTRHPEVQEAQQSVLEFLLLNHPLDCPVCDKGGECELQDLTFRYGPGASRLYDAKVRKPKAVQLGPFVVLDQERCILCRRCVRFDDEVAHEGQLVIAERGHHAEVATAGGEPYAHYFTGNTIELCPVGALTSEPYRFRARPWDLAPVASACTLCSVHCPVRLDFRHGQLVRVVSQGAPEEHLFGARGLMQAYHTPAEDVAGARGMGWLCDRGRFNYRWAQSADRLSTPLAGRGSARRAMPWDEAIEEAARAIREAVATAGPGSVAIVGGGRLMAEEAAALRALADAVGTPHRDHRTGDQAVASLATPSGRAGRMEAVGRAGIVVVVGQPPVERAPVLDLAVRQAAGAGAAVFSIGPVDPSYRGQAVRHTWAVGGAETRAAIEAIRSQVLEAVARAGREGRNATAAIVWDGKGAWDGSAAVAGEALLDLAGRLEEAGAEVHVLVPGDQPQSRAAEATGLLPGRGGLDTAGILARAARGEFRVLYLVGANLLETFPDRALVEKALETTPAVIVQDLFLTATAELATLVLPAVPAWMRDGTLVDMDGTVHRMEAALDAGADGGRSDAAIIEAIASRLGARSSSGPHGKGANGWWSGRDVDVAGEALGALAPQEARALWGGRAHAAEPRDGKAPGGPEGGLRVVVLDRLMVGGGTAAHDEAFTPKVHRQGVTLHLHPEDARRLGVAGGEPVTLATAHGAVTGHVAVDRAVGPGLAGVEPHGPGSGVNRLVAVGDRHPVVTAVQVIAGEVVR
ncbi:MAG: (2Fe-2S)-binding protein [Limnochordaceae bacterium]|nr:(2Fe-2S)-binding protein [Limnochordaceae bacterium]